MAMTEDDLYSRTFAAACRAWDDNIERHRFLFGDVLSAARSAFIVGYIDGVYSSRDDEEGDD